MDENEKTGTEAGVQDGGKPPIRSLRELIDLVTGRGTQYVPDGSESGIAESLPFPFLALVGQNEMKLALLLGLVNPAVGGVLLIGSRGTGKTTAARSLLDLLPEVMRSRCFYGCMPEDIEEGGIDAVCPDCARRWAQGLPLTTMDRVRLVELPLNATITDVVGGLDERAMLHERMRLHRGILAHADRNVLYVDEVNLLSNDIIDAILDACAQGTYTVRRGPMTATYNSRFILIGSMNPEEGHLRPQIMDRFGLRVIVKGLSDPNDRLEAYRRVQGYRSNPRALIAAYTESMKTAQDEIQSARALLPGVTIHDDVAKAGIALVRQLGIDSLRSEITLFEGARAYTASDGRSTVEYSDLTVVAPLALRLRRSPYMTDYIKNQTTEEDEIASLASKMS
jgi:magnesium chelatase subunit I